MYILKTLTKRLNAFIEGLIINGAIYWMKVVQRVRLPFSFAKFDDFKMGNLSLLGVVN